MSYAVLVRLRAGLVTEELRERLVEVNELLGVGTSLRLTLTNIVNSALAR